MIRTTREEGGEAEEVTGRTAFLPSQLRVDETSDQSGFLRYSSRDGTYGEPAA